MKINNTCFIQFLLIISCFLPGIGCRQPGKLQPVVKSLIDSTFQLATVDSPPVNQPKIDTDPTKINTGTTTPEQLLTFARTLLGVPYKYASANVDSGFDCSGFITYVFNHFGVSVPRASASFANIQKEVPLATARPGDLILFTGTDTAVHTIGHMGIVESIANDSIYFIHASSGKANGVTISPLEAYYKSRFVKLIRVFEVDVHRSASLIYNINFSQFGAMPTFTTLLNRSHCKLILSAT